MAWFFSEEDIRSDVYALSDENQKHARVLRLRDDEAVTVITRRHAARPQSQAVRERAGRVCHALSGVAQGRQDGHHRAKMRGAGYQPHRAHAVGTLRFTSRRKVAAQKA